MLFLFHRWPVNNENNATFDITFLLMVYNFAYNNQGKYDN